MTESSLQKRLDTFEEHLIKQGKTLDSLVSAVDRINIGIQGNREHDQPGYKDRIASLERAVSELTEFKKKIQYTTSLIAFIASSAVNALLFLIQKFI